MMPSLPLRWHVLGAGALGSLWSARLARTTQDRIVRPILILKNKTWSGLGRPWEWKIHVDEQHRCESSDWSTEVSLQPLSATDPIRRLLVTTKAPDVYGAMGGVIDRLEHDAVVVLLCNGMGAYEELLSDARFRNISYMLAVTTNGVYTTERFKCVHAGLGDTWVGRPMNSLLSAADADSTVASLQQSGLPVKLDEHINRTLWEKLAVNASINGITAIMNCRNGEIINSSHGMSLVTNLCSEVGQVMEASRIPPSTELLSNVLRAMHKTAWNFSSMHQDMIMGRPTEIEYINGFVVKKGLLLGVPTPTNRAILDFVKMKEQLQS